MTINTNEFRTLYTGNGGTTTFAVGFDFDADAELVVELINTSTNAVTIQVLNTDYTVSGSNIVFTTAPSASVEVLIRTGLDFEQSTDLISNDPLPADTIEDMVDEVVKQVKQLKYIIDYNIPKLPSNTLTTTTATDSTLTANYVFSLNSGADSVTLQEVTGILDINGLTAASCALDDKFVFADTSDGNSPRKGTLQQLHDLLVLGTTSYGISTLDDTTITSITDGELLSYDSGTSSWINNTLAEAGVAAASHTHATSDVTSGTFADARIAESNVTQHEAALTITESQISDLTHTTARTDEEIEDLAGGMFTGNTETGITATYEDSDGTIDLVVSDTTVAGDSGSTGITPGDTLTIAGGTDIITAMSGDTLTINVDDSFLSNSGDTGTGSYTITGDLAVDNLTFNGNTIASSSGDITIDPNGTSNVSLGNFTFDADQTVGAGQDNYVLTYDNASGTISLESGGGGGGLSDVVDDTTPQLGGNLDMNGNQITSPDGTDLIGIPNGSIDLQTASTSRLDVTDSGVRLGAANARVTTILDEDNMSSDSATSLATQQSIKAYIDSQSSSGGAWTLLATATASTSSTVDFDNLLDSTYEAYVLIISGLTMTTDNTPVDLRVGVGATPTYQSGASDYGWSTRGWSLADDFDASDAQISLTGDDGMGNAAGETAAFQVYIHSPDDASVYTAVTWNGTYHDGAGVINYSVGGGQYLATTAVTSVRILPTSSTIAAGEFKLYGLKKTV